VKVLFLYTDIGTYLGPHYPHGIGYLSAMLKPAGHRTALLWIEQDPGREALIEQVRGEQPDLIGLSMLTNQFHHLRRFAEWIHQDLGLPIIAGGIHAMVAPEEVLSSPGISMVCLGEGEEPMVELAEAMEHDRDLTGIRNLWVKHGQQIIKNPPRPLLPDLDALPFPDRELITFALPDLSLLAGRGCPYHCAYCANPARRALYQGLGQYVRRRSPRNLLAEIRSEVKKSRPPKLDFNDDVFTLDKDWLREFCAAYAAEFDIPFDVNLHVETVDREMLEMMKRAGCEWVRIGVESGSERVRREVMRRPMSEAKIKQVFRDAEAVGLLTWSFNMVGLPTETPAEAAETYRLNQELFPEHMQVSVFNPYPGTQLYELCREKGWLSGREVDGYFVPESVLNLPQFPPKEIAEWHRRLNHLSDVCKNRKRLQRQLQGKKILLDLIELLPQAEIATPLPHYVSEDYFTIGEDVRRVLMEHPPSRIRYLLQLPNASMLRFGLAMHPGVYDRPGGNGVVFTIRLGRNSQRLETVFEKTLDPKGRPEDRGWHDLSLDLRSWAGKSLVLELATQTVDPAATDYNTVGWSNPILVEAD